MANFIIDIIGNSSTYNLKARIMRYDGLYYNTATMNFETNTTDNKLINLANGSGIDAFNYRGSIEINQNFLDGEYVVQVYEEIDGILRGLSAYSVYVYNKQVTTPSPTDIAMRIVSIKVGDKDLRASLADTNKKVNELLTYVKSKL